MSKLALETFVWHAYLCVLQDLEKLRLEVPAEAKKIAGEMLMCFGEIKYTEEIVTEEVKKEETKDDDMGGKFGRQKRPGKKGKAPKMQTIVKRFTKM